MNVAGMLLDLDLSMPADEFVEKCKIRYHPEKK